MKICRASLLEDAGFLLKYSNHSGETETLQEHCDVLDSEAPHRTDKSPTVTEHLMNISLTRSRR